MSNQDGRLIEANLVDLRPTQMTVGLGEVALKRHDWQKEAPDERQGFLARHCFPAVLGPRGRYYITDHHHLGLALIEEKITTVFLNVQKDLSSTDKQEFWTVLDHLQWAHPYDAQGRRHDFDAIPKKLTKLVDDPYRSLAAEVRQAGGYAKSTAPFTEFLWADFLRRRVSENDLVNAHSEALAQALELAHTEAANHLPGWCGAAKA